MLYQLSYGMGALQEKQEIFWFTLFPRIRGTII